MAEATSTNTLAAPSLARRIIRWVAFALAISGWWLSFELAARSFDKAAKGVTSLLCTSKIDPKGDDCRAVQNSEWASFAVSNKPGAPRMPVGVLGMAYFAAVALWLLFVGDVTRSRWGWHAAVLAVCVISGFFSGDFLRIMAVVIRHWCAACIAVHAINFALIAAMILLIPFRKAAAPPSPHPQTALALATLTASGFAFLLHFVFIGARLTQAAFLPVQDAYLKISRDPEFARWQFQRQPEVATPLDRDAAGSVLTNQLDGAADAPNTLVVFSDFQCSACLKVHAIVDKILRDSPGKLRVLYRHYPLSPACNPEAESAKHPAACAAARAAIAAYSVGKGPGLSKMRKLLFERQNQLATANFEDWAGEVGLDRGAFLAALESQATDAVLAADIALAKSAGVTNTPALFLNGKRFDHWSEPATWDALLGGGEKTTSQGAAP